MPRQTSPYHSVDSKVYHIFSFCTAGNNIERDKKRSGTGNRKLCQTCKDIRAGKRDR